MGQCFVKRCYPNFRREKNIDRLPCVAFGALGRINYALDVNPIMEKIVRISMSPDRMVLITLAASGIMGAYRLREDGNEVSLPFYVGPCDALPSLTHEALHAIAKAYHACLQYFSIDPQQWFSRLMLCLFQHVPHFSHSP